MNEKNLNIDTTWCICEKAFVPEESLRNEALFSLGNGFLGMRGSFEEGYGDKRYPSIEGTYINGFYDTRPICYGEKAYGFADNSQTMLNVANGRRIRLFVGNQEFRFSRAQVSDYERVLDFKTGILTRSLSFTTPDGKKLRLEIQRLVSQNEKHIAVIRYVVTPLNFNGSLRIISSLEGNVENVVSEEDPRVGFGHGGRVLNVVERRMGSDWIGLRQKTRHTGFSVACAMSHKIHPSCDYRISEMDDTLSVSKVYDFSAVKGTPIILEKYLAYTVYKGEDSYKTVIRAESKSRNSGIEPIWRASESSPLEQNLLGEAGMLACIAAKKGYKNHCEELEGFMNTFWSCADVEIKGDKSLQQGMRFNLFHLLQSVGRDGETGVPAKGLTGEGYEGHYFWDTEIYMMPFFIYTFPAIARKLLEYRYNTLDQARARARQLSHPRGALYPWRTIGGEECSAYFPAGTAQYHINAAIAHAIKEYMDATRDDDFLIHYGAEMLFETARIWIDLGCYVPEKAGRFCIHTVTGPDEYTAMVNNNCYTNMMAASHMTYAWKTACYLKDRYADVWRALKERIALEEEEPDQWKRAADHIYIPYDERQKLYPQDDSFLEKAPWGFENTPPDKYPLLLHFHPLVIYRHRVCKQADLVLALFLLGDLFTLEEKRINYEYYERITTHDSSLSACIFSVMACEIGDIEKAYNYFKTTARTDLDDVQANTAHGVHCANMAGAWMAIVNGFAGFRVLNGCPGFRPKLPTCWEGYGFRIVFHGRLIAVDVGRQEIGYRLLKGEPIKILHDGALMTLEGKLRFSPSR